MDNQENLKGQASCTPRGCEKKFQPTQKANYFKYNFATTSTENAIAIGSPFVQKVVRPDLTSLIIADLPKEALNNAQLQMKSRLFCGFKFKVSDVSLFDVNPTLHYAEGDVQKDTSINFDDFLSEYAYKNNILTVPVAIMFDERTVLLWVLPSTPGLSATVTMNLKKVYDQIENI